LSVESDRSRKCRGGLRTCQRAHLLLSLRENCETRMPLFPLLSPDFGTRLTMHSYATLMREMNQRQSFGPFSASRQEPPSPASFCEFRTQGTFPQAARWPLSLSSPFFGGLLLVLCPRCAYPVKDSRLKAPSTSIPAPLPTPHFRSISRFRIFIGGVRSPGSAVQSPDFQRVPPLSMDQIEDEPIPPTFSSCSQHLLLIIVRS